MTKKVEKTMTDEELQASMLGIVIVDAFARAKRRSFNSILEHQMRVLHAAHLIDRKGRLKPRQGLTPAQRKVIAWYDERAAQYRWFSKGYNMALRDMRRVLEKDKTAVHLINDPSA